MLDEKLVIPLLPLVHLASTVAILQLQLSLQSMITMVMLHGPKCCHRVVQPAHAILHMV